MSVNSLSRILVLSFVSLATQVAGANTLTLSLENVSYQAGVAQRSVSCTYENGDLYVIRNIKGIKIVKSQNLNVLGDLMAIATDAIKNANPTTTAAQKSPDGGIFQITVKVETNTGVTSATLAKVDTVNGSFVSDNGSSALHLSTIIRSLCVGNDANP